MLKIYGILWVILGFAAAVAFLTGNFSDIAIVGFGFVVFGMIFMGMISVLPMTIAHPSPELKKVEPVETKSRTKAISHSGQLSTR